MTREPGAKAQLAAALVAALAYLIQKLFHLVPEEMDLLAPILSYVVAQLVGLLWARQQTTPVASPSLPPGTAVNLPDGTAGEVRRK